MAAESVCVAIFLLSCRVAVMKWSVKHVDLITTVVDVDMARSSLRDHDHDHDLRRGRCHSGRRGRGPDCRRVCGRGARPRAGWGLVLIAAVFAAVYHAEVVAHRIGEPFGTLVLALAVTIIEVALIVSVMLGVSADKAGLARDTVFAVVMIVCNGIVGLCLLWGGMRHHEQGFEVQGASDALVVLASLTILTMILPNYTVGTPGPAFSTSQLVFAAIVSLVLYGSFVFVQTLRHRAYFLD